MLNFGICYDHLEYFMAIWYNSWPFGTVCGLLLYIFPNLVCLDQEKSGNPDDNQKVRSKGLKGFPSRELSKTKHPLH
jgi:hypothetical protein